MKSTTIVAALLCSVVLLAGIVLGHIVTRGAESDLLNDLLTPAATLIAAFVGSGSAFLLNHWHEVKKAHREDVAAANRAMFLLSRFSNQLELIRRQMIEPHRKNPKRLLEMPPNLHLDYSHFRLDVPGLSFLLQTGYGNLLGKMVAEEERFHSAIRAINARSRWHFEAQERLEKAGINEEEKYTDLHIRKALGERLFQTIRMATDQAIEAVDIGLSRNAQTAAELTDAMKALFPNDVKIKFAVSPEEGDS